MNREAFESRIQDLLDLRQSPSSDPELLRAAEASPELRQLLGAYQMFGALRRPIPVPPSDLAERVVAAWREAPAARPRRTPSWLAPFVAVAATLLVATTISLLAEHGGEKVAEQPAQITVAATPEKEPTATDLNRLSQQAAANYRELAATTGQSWNSALSIMQPVKPPRVVEQEPVAESDDRWLQGVPGGLRPLSNSTTSAVYSLMRVVPSAETAEREQY
jgi:hypothetical protein